jgi:hypothetical protein
MYYRKRPVLVDTLGDLYRALAEQYDLLKRGAARCCHPSSHAQAQRTPTNPDSCSVSNYYDSQSEVDDPDQQEEEQVSDIDDPEQQQQQRGRLELLHPEVEELKERNAALREVAEENAALRAELAAKDEEKREVIRQLAASFHMMREENCSLRDCIRESKTTCPSRALDLKKVARDLFSARRLFTARCRSTAGPVVAL